MVPHAQTSALPKSPGATSDPDPDCVAIGKASGSGAYTLQVGSWNKSTAEGAKVIFVPFTNGRPGPIEDFLSGFVVDARANSKWGRPAGVTVAPDGSLLVGDDAGGKLWQVKASGTTAR